MNRFVSFLLRIGGCPSDVDEDLEQLVAQAQTGKEAKQDPGPGTSHVNVNCLLVRPRPGTAHTGSDW